MGKIIAAIHLSLDGYMADLDGQINWIAMDAELSDYVTELRQGAAGTLYGRITYQMMDPYWPNVLKNPGNFPSWQVEYAQWVDKAVKVVVSKTLPAPSWNNTRIIRGDVEREIRRIKEELDGHLLLLASATLVASLLPMGLIDELVTTFTPIVLGQGRPFFAGLTDRVPLALKETRTFSSGVVALHYRVKEANT
jgi:dihydrofolate reductase